MAVNVIKRSWHSDELVKPEMLTGMTFQSESGGHRFDITGYDAQGGVIAFSGSVTAVFLRPDNTDVALTGSLSGGVAQVTLSNECYQIPGRFGLAIFVKQDNTSTVVYDCIGTVARTSSGVVSPSIGNDVETLINRINEAVASIPPDYSELYKKVSNIYNPQLRNGSTGNPGNDNSITTQYVMRIDPYYDEILVEYIGTVKAASYEFGYSIFKGVTDMTPSFEARSRATSYIDRPNAVKTTEKYVLFNITEFGDYTHIAFVLWASDANGNRIPLRIATDQNNIRVTYRHSLQMGHEAVNSRQVQTDVQNAALKSRMLKLVHFSDLHADTSALGRLIHTADFVSPDADMICTGDIVANSYEHITDWWTPRIMTCIGNHDSASYSSGSGYDWTALSMADRCAYYITPFIDKWGSVSHPDNASYYYKDYPDKNIRMIVLDVMLYSNNSAEGNAQTQWLSDTLGTALVAGYHVLIAVHAPHDGAIPIPCSFSRRYATVYPLYTDCNTPQVVIDTVANAINNGLHFIGYICGHTHQDGIWDATGDRTQLMYCVTCASVNYAPQWTDSDQWRTPELDAANVLVIDPATTLIKIIRMGGANRAEYLQTRDTLMINYATGAIVEPDESMPSITIGTVTTVAPDQNANVTMRGTTDNPILDFDIPRGAAGTISNATGQSINVSPSDTTPIATRLDDLARQINTIDTAKLPAIEQLAQAERVLVVSGTISSLPASLGNANITADHVVINAFLDNIGALGSDWTFTTSAGTVTISGTINKSTTLTLYLAKRMVE